METKLILSYTHFTRKKPHLQFSRSSEQTLHVFDRFLPISSSLEFSLMPKYAHIDQLKVSFSLKENLFFDPKVIVLKGRKIDDRVYEYTFEVSCQSSLLACRRYLLTHPIQFDYSNLNALMNLDPKSSPPPDLLPAFDQWFPFEFRYSDTMSRFRDPQGEIHLFSNMGRSPSLKLIPYFALHQLVSASPLSMSTNRALSWLLKTSFDAYQQLLNYCADFEAEKTNPAFNPSEKSGFERAQLIFFTIKANFEAIRGWIGELVAYRRHRLHHTSNTSKRLTAAALDTFYQIFEGIAQTSDDTIQNSTSAVLSQFIDRKIPKLDPADQSRIRDFLTVLVRRRAIPLQTFSASLEGNEFLRQAADFSSLKFEDFGRSGVVNFWRTNQPCVAGAIPNQMLIQLLNRELQDPGSRVSEVLDFDLRKPPPDRSEHQIGRPNLSFGSVYQKTLDSNLAVLWNRSELFIQDPTHPQSSQTNRLVFTAEFDLLHINEKARELTIAVQGKNQTLLKACSFAEKKWRVRDLLRVEGLLPAANISLHRNYIGAMSSIASKTLFQLFRRSGEGPSELVTALELDGLLGFTRSIDGSKSPKANKFSPCCPQKSLTFNERFLLTVIGFILKQPEKILFCFVGVRFGSDESPPRVSYLTEEYNADIKYQFNNFRKGRQLFTLILRRPQVSYTILSMSRSRVVPLVKKPPSDRLCRQLAPVVNSPDVKKVVVRWKETERFFDVRRIEQQAGERLVRAYCIYF